MHLTVRPSTADDAASIGALVAEFQAYLRALGDETPAEFSAAKYARDGFGDDPAFEGIVADVDGKIVGYALYHFGYDCDRGERVVWLIDLFVSSAFRRSGIGERLMERLSEIGRARRAVYVVWSVLKENRLAIDFYEKLGANRVDDLQFMWRPIPALELDRAD